MFLLTTVKQIIPPATKGYFESAFLAAPSNARRERISLFVQSLILKKQWIARIIHDQQEGEISALVGERQVAAYEAARDQEASELGELLVAADDADRDQKIKAIAAELIGGRMPEDLAYLIENCRSDRGALAQYIEATQANEASTTQANETTASNEDCLLYTSPSPRD